MAAESFSRAVLVRFALGPGQVLERKLIPVAIQWSKLRGKGDYQWLLYAHDVERGENFTLPLVGISSWKPPTEEEYELGPDLPPEGGTP
jgi:hypothetical protein